MRKQRSCQNRTTSEISLGKAMVAKTKLQAKLQSKEDSRKDIATVIANISRRVAILAIFLLDLFILKLQELKHFVYIYWKLHTISFF